MFLYMLLFAWAMDRVTTVDDGANESLLASDEQDPLTKHGHDKARQVHDMDRTFSLTHHSNHDIFADIGRKMSFSVRADPTGEFVDEQTPLRSVSVA
jgi:hypothetical protein